MRRLPRETRAQILAMLVDGNSVSGTVRLTGISKPTILKLLIDAGRAAGDFHNRTARNLACRYVEVDELWTFVQMKQKRALAEGRNGVGDVYTFTSIDPETKLAPTWLCGSRDTETATRFLVDLSRRIPGRFQVSSDAASFYREAAERAFGGQVDYAQIWKHSVPKEEARDIPKNRTDADSLAGESRPGAYRYIVCRAAEFDHALEHAPLHAKVEWFQQAEAESGVRGCLAFHSLQFHSTAWHVDGGYARQANHSGNGRRTRCPSVEVSRFGRNDRSARRIRQRRCVAAERLASLIEFGSFRSDPL